RACGDFSLTDSGTMFAIGGMDESVREARLHLDSRLCVSVMGVVEDCVPLGSIYHITHTNSYRFQRRAKGRLYVWDQGLPYVNPPDWGLADFTWHRIDDRYYRVTLPVPGAPRSVPERLPADARSRADAVRESLLAIRDSLHPERPLQAASQASGAVNLWQVAASPDWGSSIQRAGDRLWIETAPVQWGFAALFPVTQGEAFHDDWWYWVHASLQVEDGSVSIAVVDEAMNILHDRYIHRGADEQVYIPLPPSGRYVLIRNIDDNQSRSILILSALEVVAHSKEAAVAV
ncbi:MAG: hypothetical protein ACREMT_03390, partial [Vulcanimicrobiaceae bacterium]